MNEPHASLPPLGSGEATLQQAVMGECWVNKGERRDTRPLGEFRPRGNKVDGVDDQAQARAVL